MKCVRVCSNHSRRFPAQGTTREKGATKTDWCNGCQFSSPQLSGTKCSGLHFFNWHLPLELGTAYTRLSLVRFQPLLWWKFPPPVPQIKKQSTVGGGENLCPWRISKGMGIVLCKICAPWQRQASGNALSVLKRTEQSPGKALCMLMSALALQMSWIFSQGLNWA